MAPRPRRHSTRLAALALLLAPAAASAQGAGNDGGSSVALLPELALLGTVPIYWGEADGLQELIGGEVRPHWARAVLERRWHLVPLDHLDAAALERHTRLLLAQPRALAPAENVALDAWVRGGGQLLLLADPMMTGASRFSLADRRRPQGVALLSPILARWGIGLRFDPEQPAGLRYEAIGGARVPLNLPGVLSRLGDGGLAGCAPEEGGAVWLQCRLGQGRIAVLADAALVDLAGPWPGAPEALEALTARAFTDGEITGQ